MHYLSVETCRQSVFPFIYKELTREEAAPQYESEPQGLKELEKVLTLIQDDTYYPTFSKKAAYLLCSIAGSQYFSNGNKRLAVMALVTFLIVNNAQKGELTMQEFKDLLAEYFQRHRWEDNRSISGAHSLFLYNLALIIGDRSRWSDGDDFSLLKDKIAMIFEYLYRV